MEPKLPKEAMCRVAATVTVDDSDPRTLAPSPD